MNRLIVLMYVRFPLSLRNLEDLLCERGIDICHKTERLWWNSFATLFAVDIRRQRVSQLTNASNSEDRKHELTAIDC